MGGGAPLDQSHTGQGGSVAPVDKGAVLSTEGVGDALRGWAGGRLRGTGTARADVGVWGVPTIETTMLIVEVPLAFLMAPDTPTANKSSPWKSDLAVYEKPEPNKVTRPNCGGEIRLIASITTLLKRTPRRQLWPLRIVIRHSTVSECN